MFIFNINKMLKELETNYSGYNVLSKLPKIDSQNYEEELKKLYSECEAISIDYAVMEKSKDVYVVPGDFGWDDIGTWKSLERYIEKDENSNILNGNITCCNSKDNIIYTGDKKVILLDVNDVCCIETDDVLIIANKDSIDKIHELRNMK